MAIEHGERCAECWCRRCRAFSTDGTRLGQIIAHTQGTTSELTHREQIILDLTGMPEEQADWESDED